MCFIHSSSVPSSVTTELICTGTTCPAGKSGSGRQVDFEQTGLLQLTFGIRQDLSRLIAASDCRRIEPEFGGLPGEKTEISSFDEEFRALLHPLRNNAQRLYRRFESRHSRHRALEANVVRTRRSGLDPNTFLRHSSSAIERSPFCDGEIQFDPPQLANRFSLVPRSEQLEHSVADRPTLENTAVKKDRGWHHEIRLTPAAASTIAESD